MWVASGEIVYDTEKQTVQSPKSILTIVRNLGGFHAVKTLSKGGKFNVQYYTNNVLIAISDSG
jgi:hypothetical protein